MVLASSDDATPTHGRSQRWPRLQPLDALAEISRIVVGTEPLSQVLTRIAEMATACVPGAEEVSITLLEGEGKPSSAAFTGTLAIHLDERQYAAGFGPCLTAARTGQVIRIDDTGHESTYRDFAAIAAREGVRSTLSVGMSMPQLIQGSVNVYTLDPAPLAEDAVQVLQTFADHAAVALTNHTRYALAVEQSAQLQQAMRSRAVIEQAKGVLVARLRCTPEEAFAHLAKRSQDTNRKLRDLAVEVVADAVAVPDATTRRTVTPLDPAPPPVWVWSGEVDAADKAAYTVALQALLEDHPATLVIDLGAVTFLDCAAVSVLVRARDDPFTRLLLRDVPVRVRRMLQVLGLGESFAVVEPLDLPAAG
jgi:anti-anti-sigma factor